MLCRVLSHLFLITLGGELGNLLALIVQMRKLRLREVKSCVQHHSARILHCSWHYLQISIDQLPGYPQRLAGHWTKLSEIWLLLAWDGHPDVADVCPHLATGFIPWGNIEPDREAVTPCM